MQVNFRKIHFHIWSVFIPIRRSQKVGIFIILLSVYSDESVSKVVMSQNGYCDQINHVYFCLTIYLPGKCICFVYIWILQESQQKGVLQYTTDLMTAYRDRWCCHKIYGGAVTKSFLTIFEITLIWKIWGIYFFLVTVRYM